MVFLVLLLLRLASAADSVLLSLGNASGVRVLECTFIETIVEDHFIEQQHFRYGACSLDGVTAYPFGLRILHLINLHGEAYHRGQKLLLSVRNATKDDLREQHLARRKLQPQPQSGPHAPMWQESRAGGYFVEQVLRSTARRRHSARVRGRTLGTKGRTLLSLCMQYTHSTHTCTASDEPWNMGVPQTHATASYGRLKPAWDQDNSRFYIIQMDTIDRGEQMDFTKISCETFMENEPAKALEYAREQYADALLSYSHTEFIVPTNLDACEWAGIATL